MPPLLHEQRELQNVLLYSDLAIFYLSHALDLGRMCSVLDKSAISGVIRILVSGVFIFNPFLQTSQI